MAPIEAGGSYYNYLGEFIDSSGTFVVDPGQEATIVGKVATVKVSCKEDDSGGAMEIVEVADVVKKGGFRGLDGFMGPRIETTVGHSEKGSVKVRGGNGADVFRIRHNPHRSEQSPI